MYLLGLLDKGLSTKKKYKDFSITTNYNTVLVNKIFNEYSSWIKKCVQNIYFYTPPKFGRTWPYYRVAAPPLPNIVTKGFNLGLKRKLQAYHSSDEEEGVDDAPVKKNKKPVMGEGYDPLALIKVSFYTFM